MTEWTPIGRVTAFVEALERAGHGTAIVSCRYGHEAHWPGPIGEYMPLHAGDLRDLVDELVSLKTRVAASGHEPDCAGGHMPTSSCVGITKLRADMKANDALWNCRISTSRGQPAHRFRHPKEPTAECLNGCGITWARLQEAQ